MQTAFCHDHRGKCAWEVLRLGSAPRGECAGEVRECL